MARAGGAAALAGVERPELCKVTAAAQRVPRRLPALLGELVGDEPVAELGIVVVDVDCGTNQVGGVVVTLADRLGLTLVERLLEEAKQSASDSPTVAGRLPLGTADCSVTNLCQDALRLTVHIIA